MNSNFNNKIVQHSQMLDAIYAKYWILTYCLTYLFLHWIKEAVNGPKSDTVYVVTCIKFSLCFDSIDLA